MTIKRLSEKKFADLLGIIETDDEYRYDRIKVSTGQKGKFEVPAPSTDDPDKVEFAKAFKGVIIHFEKNFFQTDEDKAAGKDPKEKREVIVLREGQFEPELMYLSPSSVKRFDSYITALSKRGIRPREVLTNFDCEQVQHTVGSTLYKYGVVNFSEVTVLDEEEIEYTTELRSVVYGRAQRYKQTVDQSAVEAAIHDDLPVPSSGRRVSVEVPDEAEAPKTAKAEETEEAPAPAARPRRRLTEEDV